MATRWQGHAGGGGLAREQGPGAGPGSILLGGREAGDSPDLTTHLQLPGEVWCPRLAMVAERQAELQAVVWVRGKAQLAVGMQ